MKTNDSRNRQRDKFTKSYVYATSWSEPSTTTFGTEYLEEGSVQSYRTGPGQEANNGFQTFSLTKKDGSKTRIRAKEPNEFNLVKTSRNRAPGRLYVSGYGSSGKDWYSREGDLLDLYWPDTWVKSQTFWDDTRVAGPAINEAYERANSPQLAGFTQIVEMKESLNMLGELGLNTYMFIAKMKRNLARHRKTAVSDVSVDDLAALWLSYRYGFLPLYLSIKDIISSNLAKPSSELMVFDGTASRVIDSSSTTQTSIGGHPFAVYFDRQGVRKANSRLYIQYKRDPNPFGFGAYDIMLAAWEKVTLSFVVDWFVGVGSWLGAYRPGGVKPFWSYCTVVQDFTSITTATVRKGPTASTGVPSFSSSPRKWRRSRVTRLTPVSPTLLPAWEFEALQWYRQIDSLALSWKILGDMLRKG